MNRLWAPWRMEYVSGDAVPSDGCVLCSIAAAEGGGSRHIVERTLLTFTLLNRFPYSSGHVMVVPNRHVTEFTELSDAEGAAVMAGAQRAVLAITSALHAEGFNVGLNCGSVAGASIEHVHLHVVPRWGGDTNFMPVVGDVKVLPQALDATADALRSAWPR